MWLLECLFGRTPRTLKAYAKKHKMSIRALCKLHGLAESTVRMRVKRGWSIERALSTPVRGKE